MAEPLATPPPPAPAPKPARQKRGVRFWLKIALCLLAATPLVLYIAARVYVNFGFMNASIEQRLSQKFGTTSRVGSMQTDALQNLSINEIAIDPSGGGEPLTIGATKLNFRLYDFLVDNRIGAITLDRPHIALRYDPEKGWNHSLKLGPAPGEGLRINQFDITDGVFSIEWPAGKKFSLTNINAAVTSDGRPVTPFTFSGELPSSEQLKLEGQMGPGRDFNTHLSGAVQLEQDAPAMAGFDPGLKGFVRYDFSAKRESPPSSVAPADKLLVNGTVALRNIAWPLPGNIGLHLQLPMQELSVQAGIEEPSGAPSTVLLRDFTLDLGPLGTCSANASLERNSPRYTTVSDAKCSINLDAVNTAFQPPLLGRNASIKGAIDISGVSASVPIDNGAPPATIQARIAARDAHVTFPGGQPTPVTASADLKFPALQNGSVSFGNLAALEFQIDDLTKADTFEALTQNIRITRGRFSIDELFAAVGGEITSGALQLKWITPYTTDGPSKLRISGMRVKGIAVDEWVPFLPASDWRLSGPLSAELDFDRGALKVLLLIADLFSKNERTGQVASGSVRWQLERTRPNSADMTTTVFEADPVSIPVDSANQVFPELKNSGILVSGTLKGSKIRYDSGTEAMTGRVRLEDGSAECPITAKDRLFAADALDIFGYGVTAAMLRNVNLCDRVRAKQLSAELTFNASRARIHVSGTTNAAPLFLHVPLWDKEAGQLPPAAFAFDAIQVAFRSYSIKSVLDWGGGKVSANALQIADNNWSIKAGFFAGNSDKPDLNLAGAIDLKNNIAGPLSLTADLIPLARPKTAQSGGAIKQLRASIDPFSMAPGVPITASAHLTGELDKACFASPGNTLTDLSGVFTAQLTLDDRQLKMVSGSRLDSYAATLADGAVIVPPPVAGQFAMTRLNLSLPLDAKPFGSSARIDACEFEVKRLAKFIAAGSASFSGGDLTSVQLRDIELTLPDLAAVTDAFGPANLKGRDYWFGDLKLAGKARFAGACMWTKGQIFPLVPGESALDGNLEIENGSLRIGTATPFTMDGLKGAIPVSLRRGAGVPRDGGPKASIFFENAAYAKLQAREQNLEIEGLSNGFTVHTPIDFTADGAKLSIGPISLGNILPSAQAPRCAFRMRVNLDIDQILRTNGVPVAGMSDCIFSGEPIECALVKTDGARGPYELKTGCTADCKGDAQLTAPFYGGKLVAREFNARGIFGPNPSFGGAILAVGKNWPEHNDGINVQEFFKHYPQYGKFNVRMSGTLANFETTSLDLSGIQSFTLDLDSVPGQKNEYWYDGALAMALNYPLVRASFPSFFGDNYIRALTFGIKELSAQFILEKGTLFGPIPKLPGGLILRGYGAESNPFASRYKKDIHAGPDYHKPWADAVRAVKEKFSRPKP